MHFWSGTPYSANVYHNIYYRGGIVYQYTYSYLVAYSVRWRFCGDLLYLRARVLTCRKYTLALGYGCSHYAIMIIDTMADSPFHT